MGSLVSIVIAAHNAVGYLDETLASAVAQRYNPLEIIVVDDGSTDATAELVRGWSERDPRIRLIQQANAGVGAARNTGIAAARGRYIAPLDADDLWDPDKITAQVAEMELWGPRAGFAYCWVRTINEHGRMTGIQPRCSASGGVFGALLIGNFLHNASVPLFRADALKLVGGYATREEQGGVQGCEDWELCLRVANRYDVCVVPRVLVSYRIVQSGMSFNVRGMERSYLWLLGEARRLR
ncbi:MAG TPA: glycosyltransferase family A protein, partial [Opitutaceae bacterium]|nr:glycosyltransferase family A protein [Opitutaceae bacterium]